MASDLDLTDRQLLNILQSSFPLTEAPFAEIGRELSLSQDDVIDRVRLLKAKNVVRQISAIFDTRRLGYTSTLVAMRLDDSKLESGARIINEHPGVSHNYGRTGQFNLWFTVAVPLGESLEDTVQDLGCRAGAETWHMLPTIRFFKIGVNFDMVKGEGASENFKSPEARDNGESAALDPVTETEKECIRELQEDLSLDPHPFEDMAARLDLTQQELFERAADFQDRGLMRRFSAVLHHRRAGFSANSMVVWNVPEERAVEVGNTMARSRWVTHCYQRPTFPEWSYSHFSMVHAATREQCEAVAKEISEATSIDDYMLIYSIREYKKTRVHYFV